MNATVTIPIERLDNDPAAGLQSLLSLEELLIMYDEPPKSHLIREKVRVLQIMSEDVPS